MSKHVKASIISLIIVACLVLFILWIQHDIASKQKATRQIPPTVVNTAKATQQEWRAQIKATGTLEATQGITLKSAVTQGGIITGIFFRSGQYVKAGQPLFQLNPGADRTIIRAPFSGRLGLKQVDLGDFVSQGTSLVTLQDTDPMKVDFTVPQTYLGVLGLGQEVTVTANAYPNKGFRGAVYAINSQLDSNTRSLEMWASIPNKDQVLVPGTFVEVTLYAGEKRPVVTVPQSAIVYANTGDFVYRIVNNRAVQTNVILGQRRGNLIAIKQGLDIGSEVATSGQNKFADGWPLIPFGSPQYMEFLKKIGAKVPAGLNKEELTKGLTPVELQTLQQLSVPEQGAFKKMTKEQQKAFLNLSPMEQGAYMKMNPSDQKVFIDQKVKNMKLQASSNATKQPTAAKDEEKAKASNKRKADKPVTQPAEPTKSSEDKTSDKSKKSDTTSKEQTSTSAKPSTNDSASKQQ